jgi:hypothetical protein
MDDIKQVLQKIGTQKPISIEPVQTTDVTINSATNDKITQLIKDYIKMDKSYRLKHESLKTLHQAYFDLYKKYKNSGSGNASGNASAIGHQPSASENILIDENQHKEMIHSIHGEMKENNTNLYRERIMILKKIKETPNICPIKKEQICGRLLAVFKSPPVSDYRQPQVEQLIQESNADKPVNVSDLDQAYFRKHNELMTIYKAYRNLFKKTLNYKDELDEYKKLNTGSSITTGQMNKLVDDQKFVMNMIDKMQDELIDRKILNTSDKVPVAPVANNPQNMAFFNNSARDQIRNIITRDVNITPSARNSIARILTSSSTSGDKTVECDSNEEFCRNGGKIIVLGKVNPQHSM